MAHAYQHFDLEIWQAEAGIAGEAGTNQSLFANPAVPPFLSHRRSPS